VCVHQRTHRESTLAFGLDVGLAGRNSRAVDGTDIGGVEVDAMIGYRKVGADAKRIVPGAGRRSGRRGRGKSGDEPGGSRSRHKRTTSDGHASYCAVLLAALLQQAVVLVTDDEVARAGALLQAAAVDDPDETAAVLDQFHRLEFRSHF